MKKTFKFRAWDNFKNRMSNPDYIGTDGYCYDYSPEDGEGLDIELDRYNLMQFTGLFDKNKQEIWESDILEYEDKVYIVYWELEEGRWYLKSPDGSEYDSGDFHCPYNTPNWKMFAKIGNVFENYGLFVKK